MKTRIRRVSAATAMLVFALATVGCGKYSFSSLKAIKAFKEANAHYAGERWREAASRYEDALSNEGALEANPNLRNGYFFLGHSYDMMFKPARKGEADNDALMAKAIDAYTKAAQTAPDPIFQRRAMEYLAAAYGPEKLGDPASAEPVVQKLITLDPSEPTSYFALSKIYVDAGRYEEAEAALLKARDAKPNDPAVYTALAGFYNTQGEFEKTMEAFARAAELDPNNPQGYHLMGSYYQEKASKDFRLTPAQKQEYNKLGIEAEDKALALNPNYVDALVYKNILLRQLALVEKDPARQKQLIQEADDLRNKAMALQKGAAAAGAKPAAGTK